MPLRENKAGAARIFRAAPCAFCTGKGIPCARAHFVRGRGQRSLAFFAGECGPLRPCAFCAGKGAKGRAFLHSDSAALSAADADAEEERRLFYVGMTRAKDELILTTSGAPSPFLSDLPADVRREKAQPRSVWRQLSLF